MRLSAGDYYEISLLMVTGNPRQRMIDSGKGKRVLIYIRYACNVEASVGRTSRILDFIANPKKYSIALVVIIILRFWYWLHPSGWCSLWQGALHAAPQLRYLSMTNHLSAARPRSCLQSWARPRHGWTNLKHIHPVHDLWMFISTRFPQHIFLGPYYFSVSFHPVVSARKNPNFSPH